MAQLSGAEILGVWERGATQDWVNRGLTLLAAASPDARDELAALTIGTRDARLFQLRAQLFGYRLPCFAECRTCAAPLQFDLDARQFCQPPVLDDLSLFHVTTDEFRVRFRPLNSEDLAAASACGAILSMRRTLIERCIVEVVRDGRTADADSLPRGVIEEIGDRMAQSDAAELMLDLQCAACGQSWREPFDILSFLWTEIARSAKGLLQEVHTLAWAYGWSEAEILAMSPVRRRVYLEWVQ